MIKRIRIMSHDEAVRYRPSVSTMMIRVLDSDACIGDSGEGNEALRYADDFKVVFSVVVDDIKRDVSDEYPGMVLFSEMHADWLCGVFDCGYGLGDFAGIEEAVVHCRAGVSRSAAIGVLFARYLKRIDMECGIYLNHDVLPNSHILSFAEYMGIEAYEGRDAEMIERLTRLMLASDHEGMSATVRKYGLDVDDLVDA